MTGATDPTQDEAQAGARSEFSGATEISRRVGSILDAVELEAQRLREEARLEAARYLDHARARADSLVAERQRRIAAVSDELLAKAEAVVGRLDDAAPVREGFENLVRALGDAAERLARETEAGRDFEPPPFHDLASVPAPPPAHPGGFAAAPAAEPMPTPPPEPVRAAEPRFVPEPEPGPAPGWQRHPTEDQPG